MQSGAVATGASVAFRESSREAGQESGPGIWVKCLGQEAEHEQGVGNRQGKSADAGPEARSRVDPRMMAGGEFRRAGVVQW
jgi:hypothetical protein